MIRTLTATVRRRRRRWLTRVLLPGLFECDAVPVWSGPSLEQAVAEVRAMLVGEIEEGWLNPIELIMKDADQRELGRYLVTPAWSVPIETGEQIGKTILEPVAAPAPRACPCGSDLPPGRQVYCSADCTPTHYGENSSGETAARWRPELVNDTGDAVLELLGTWPYRGLNLRVLEDTEFSGAPGPGARKLRLLTIRLDDGYRFVQRGTSVPRHQSEPEQLHDLALGYAERLYEELHREENLCPPEPPEQLPEQSSGVASAEDREVARAVCLIEAAFGRAAAVAADFGRQAQLVLEVGGEPPVRAADLARLSNYLTAAAEIGDDERRDDEPGASCGCHFCSVGANVVPVFVRLEDGAVVGHIEIDTSGSEDPFQYDGPA